MRHPQICPCRHMQGMDEGSPGLKDSAWQNISRVRRKRELSRNIPLKPLAVLAQVTRRESYDESCDIFALGCLLYDLWTRQLRFVALFEHAAHANVLGQYAARV